MPKKKTSSLLVGFGLQYDTVMLPQGHIQSEAYIMVPGADKLFRLEVALLVLVVDLELLWRTESTSVLCVAVNVPMLEDKPDVCSVVVARMILEGDMSDDESLTVCTDASSCFEVKVLTMDTKIKIIIL